MIPQSSLAASRTHLCTSRLRWVHAAALRVYRAIGLFLTFLRLSLLLCTVGFIRASAAGQQLGRLVVKLRQGEVTSRQHVFKRQTSGHFQTGQHLPQQGGYARVSRACGPEGHEYTGLLPDCQKPYGSRHGECWCDYTTVSALRPLARTVRIFPVTLEFIPYGRALLIVYISYLGSS